MTTYATRDDLRAVAAAYGVPQPGDSEADRALALASHDVDLYLIGVGPVDMTALTAAQLNALTDATATQAAFRIEQGPIQLGVDDGISAVAGMTFSLRSPARFSPEAADRLAGLGLLKRSGCAPPPPPPIVPPPWP